MVDDDGELQGIVLAGSPQGGFDRILPLNSIEAEWPGLVRDWPADGADATNHFYRHARGQFGSRTTGEFYRGRKNALTAIASFLVTKGGDRTPLVVTGDPGSGKSSVVARAAHEASLTSSDRGLIFHAKSALEAHLLDAVAAAIGCPTPESPEELIPAIEEDGRPLLLFIDALDEAHSPRETLRICDALIVLSSSSSVKVVLGTRRNIDGYGTLSSRLGVPEASTQFIDLDAPDYRDDDAITSLAYSLLLQENVAHPRPGDGAWAFYRANHSAGKALSASIAEVANGNFLVATLAASALSASLLPHDPRKPGFSVSVIPTSVGDALEKYLESLRRRERQVAEGLLGALAHARGEGISTNRWRDFASAIGVNVSTRKLERFHDSGVVNYLVLTDRTADEPTVRLFHQALIDELLQRGNTRDQKKIFDLLMQQADEAGTWATADLYVRTHLVDHAPNAKEIDRLLLRGDFAAIADPQRLIEAVGSNIAQLSSTLSEIVSNEASRLVLSSEIYRRFLLSVAATHAGEVELAQCFLPDSSPLVPIWGTPLHIGHVKLLGHSGSVMSVAIIDQITGLDCIATGGIDGTVRLWDQYGRATGVINLPGSVHSVVESTVRGILTVGGPRFVARVDVAERAIVSIHEQPTLGARDVAACAINDDFFFGSPRGIERISSDGLRSTLVSRERSRVAFTPDGNMVALTSPGRLGWLSWLSPSSEVRTSYRKRAKAIAIGTYKNHQLIAVAGADRTVSLVSPDPDEPVRVLGHTHSLARATAVAELSGELVVAVGSTSPAIDVFAGDGNHWVLRGHSGGVTSLAIGSIGETPILASASNDGSGRIWRNIRVDARDFYARNTLVFSVTSSLGETLYMSTDTNGRVHLRSATGETIRSNQTIAQAIRVAAVATIENVPMMAFAAGRTIHVCNVVTGDLISSFPTGNSSVTSIAMKSDGSIISGSKDGHIQRWAYTGQSDAPRVEAHHRDVTALESLIVGNKTYVVSAGRDGRVLLWTEDLALAQEFRAGSRVRSLAVGEDAHHSYVAVGTNSSILVWSSENWRRRREIVTDLSTVSAMTFAEFDNELCLVFSDKEHAEIRVFSVKSGLWHVMPSAERIVALTASRDTILAASDAGIIAFRTHSAPRGDLWDSSIEAQTLKGAEIQHYKHRRDREVSASGLLRSGHFAEAYQMSARLPLTYKSLALRADSAFALGTERYLYDTLATVEAMSAESTEINESDALIAQGRVLGLSAALQKEDRIASVLSRIQTTEEMWSTLAATHSMFAKNPRLEWSSHLYLIEAARDKSADIRKVVVLQASSRLFAVSRGLSTAGLKEFHVERLRLSGELFDRAAGLEHILADALNPQALESAPYRPYQLVSLIELYSSLNHDWHPDNALPAMKAGCALLSRDLMAQFIEWRAFSPILDGWLSAKLTLGRRQARSSSI